MSTIHTIHGDIMLHGLSEECPRCQQHAAEPFVGLDSDNLKRLFEGTCFTALDKFASRKIHDEYEHARLVLRALGQ